MKNNFLLLLLFISIQYVDGQIPNNEVKLDFSNPSFFAGSTLPNVYQRLWINGDYSTMLKFTSNQSRSKFGDSALLEYFQMMDFGYTLKLKSRNFQKDGTQTLNCESQINATKKIVRFKCKVENDTAKMIIVNLNKMQFP
jgi:hypothetical protein